MRSIFVYLGKIAVGMMLFAFGFILDSLGGNCADGQKIPIKISKPSTDEEKLIKISSLGEVSTRFISANPAGTALDNNLTWTIGGFSFVNDNNTGCDVRIKLASWPTNEELINNIFGKQAVELEYVSSSRTGDCETEIEVKVFFPADHDKLVGIGDDRLWFTYWGKMGAINLDNFRMVDVDGGPEAFGPLRAGQFVSSVTASLNDEYLVTYDYTWYCKIHPKATICPLASGSTKLEKVGSIVGHELGHEEYTKDEIVDIIVDDFCGQLNSYPLSIRQTWTDEKISARVSKLFEDNRTLRKNESEALALEYNDSYAEQITKEKDWSIGGHNDSP